MRIFEQQKLTATFCFCWYTKGLCREKEEKEEKRLDWIFKLLSGFFFFLFLATFKGFSFFLSFVVSLKFCFQLLCRKNFCQKMRVQTLKEFVWCVCVCVHENCSNFKELFWCVCKKEKLLKLQIHICKALKKQ